VFTIGFLRYGLGLINLDQQIILIIIGALMILSVAAQEVKAMMESRSHKRRVLHDTQTHLSTP
jgi:rhamnose transport system permease protein